MSAGVQPLSIGELTTRLDGLSPDQDPEYLATVLRIALADRKLYNQHLSSLIKDEERAKAMLEVFDKALTASEHDVRTFKKFRQLCGRIGILPASHIIPEKCVKTSEVAVASGGFGDVWEGIYDKKRVAIKALRVYKEDDVRRVAKLFCKEVVIWRRIAHPNIVPLLGVSSAPAPLSMVSEWMSNGNVRDYVWKNPDTSRLQLLLDVGHGLSYLHSLRIVHGDLKGDNILVDESGCARLNDFGFTSIAGIDCTETSASRFKGTHRWMAPELFSVDETEGFSTRESDIFALGMVTFEVFTGEVPFSENKASAIVIKRITDGERPSRPPKANKLGLSDEFWEIVQASLAHEVQGRPAVSVFVDFLEEAVPDINMLRELTEFDASSEGDIQKLRRMFDYSDNALLGMREDKSVVVVEVFDRVLNSSLVDSQLRGRCIRGLQKISARCGVLPKSFWVSSSLAGPGNPSSATGKVPSTCQQLMDGMLVAVKTVGPVCIENFSALKNRLCTNGVMWKRLRHPNVVDFLGFGSDSHPISLVYPWMTNGNLSEYLRKRPDADKLGLLLDIARGLAYLHQYNLVHGNLTGNNILVDSDGIACISECGLEIALRGPASSKPTMTKVRSMAPEVLTTENKDKRATSVDDGKRADIYSLAVVMFEVLSGTIIYPKESDEDVVKTIGIGLRPEWSPEYASQGLGDAVWDQIEACWSHDPEERPTALEVLHALQALGEDEEERPQEVREPLVPSDDDSWDYVEDTPGTTPVNSKGRSVLSGSTLVNSSIGRIFGSGTTKHVSGRRRERVRHLLHLPKHGSSASDTEKRKPETLEKRKPEVVERRKPETLIDQREDVARVVNGCVPYLSSQPIPTGKKLKKVVVTVVSKDQGWSSYPSDHGTYRNSNTWFELSVGSPVEGSEEKWRGEVVKNLHAHDDFKDHTIEISDEGLYEKAEGGDVLTVWAHARYSGWKNTVKKAKIRYVVE